MKDEPAAKHPREMTLAELEALPVAIRVRGCEFRFVDQRGNPWRVGRLFNRWFKTLHGDTAAVALALPVIRPMRGL